MSTLPRAALLHVLLIAHAAHADTINVGRGPVTVHVPASYSSGTPTPVVMLLHGYGSSGASIASYFRFIPQSETSGFLLIYPDGLRDAANNRFWNATDACCDLFNQGPDDAAYLQDLLDEMELLYNVDPDRVYIAGHSNGGFMSYRMACQFSHRIAAIASLAGATYLDPADCVPTSTLHTLQIHGTSDTVIRYNGGCISACYPSAIGTTERWALNNDCSLTQDTSAPPIDIDSSLPGAETQIISYTSLCAPGGSATLWKINSGSHSPSLNSNFARLVAEFFYARPKHNCPADYNNDATLDAFDYDDFVNDFFNYILTGTGFPDYNNDGYVDAFDYDDFVSDFFTGCA